MIMIQSTNLGEHSLGKYVIMSLPDPLANHGGHKHAVEDANNSKEPKNHKARNEENWHACLASCPHRARTLAYCCTTSLTACCAVCPQAQSSWQVTIAQPGRQRRTENVDYGIQSGGQFSFFCEQILKQVDNGWAYGLWTSPMILSKGFDWPFWSDCFWVLTRLVKQMDQSIWVVGITFQSKIK